MHGGIFLQVKLAIALGGFLHLPLHQSPVSPTVIIWTYFQPVNSCHCKGLRHWQHLNLSCVLPQANKLFCFHRTENCQFTSGLWAKHRRWSMWNLMTCEVEKVDQMTSISRKLKSNCIYTRRYDLFQLYIHTYISNVSMSLLTWLHGPSVVIVLYSCTVLNSYVKLSSYLKH